MSDRPDLRTRAYRVLLRLLPAPFRVRHGEAMEDTYLAKHDRVRERGVAPALWLWVREALDLCRAAVALRVADAAVSAESRRSIRFRRRFFGSFRDDLTIALRATLRNQRFMLLAVLTLALGVGATTAMYGAFKAVVLDPLPFPEPESLVVPWMTMGTRGAMIGLESSETQLLREAPGLFTGVEEFGAGTVTVSGAGEPIRMLTVKMTPGLPDMLGMSPLLGRTFTRNEVAGDGARVLLLSHSLWQSWFGGSRDVLGRTIMANGEAWTIIGVMPAAAARPDGDARPVDLWLPLAESDWDRSPIARLADGVTPEAATSRVDAIVGAATGARFGGTVVPVLAPGPLHDHMRMLMVAVMLLLLVACVNVSSLLLQRAAERRTEIAIRTALGAARLQIIRQLMLESMTVAGLGALLGAVFAWLGLRGLVALRPDQLEVLRTVRIDGGVLLFCVATATAAGLLFGLLPAVRGSRSAALAALGRGTRTGEFNAGRTRWLLVTGEVALSFALLLGAALVATSLRQLATQDTGYAAAGLISVDVSLPSWRYSEPAARSDVFDRMLVDIRRHPGVLGVALATGVPPRMPGRFGRVGREGLQRDDSPTRFHGADIDTAFLSLIGQPLKAGRDFTRDDATSPDNPVILAESAARTLFDGEPGIGRRFSLEGGAPNLVVGIVRDIEPAGLAGASNDPLVYWPLRQPRSRMTLIVRAGTAVPGLLPDLRRAIYGIEADAVVDIATVPELLGASLARERFTTALLTTFSALALLLAVIGLYGVLSQVVTSRTREIGVRVALGATTSRIGVLIMRTGLSATLIGMTAGAFLAFIGMRLLGTQIFGLTTRQPSAYVLATAALLLASVLAMLVPTLRAVRVDPARAIRGDG